jgi:cytochrome P450
MPRCRRLILVVVVRFYRKEAVGDFTPWPVRGSLLRVSQLDGTALRGKYAFDFDPFRSPDREDPHPTLHRARRERPVFYSRRLQTWVVTRCDDVLAILRDPGRFSSANAITNVPAPPPQEVLQVLATGVPYEPNSVDLDPPRHASFRALINHAFLPRRITAIEPQVRALAERLVDTFAADGQTDLVARLAHPLPTLVIGDLLGVPHADMPAFTRWSGEWLVLLGQLGDVGRLVAAAGEVVDFQRYVAGMIADRRANPGSDDLVADIVASTGDVPQPPSDHALVSLVMTVLFAGHETTTSLITNTVKLLLHHPDQLAEVRADRSLLSAAITETLRFDPPVPGMYRTTTAEVSVGGVTLPAGEHLHISFAAANRDPAHFAEPDRFDLHRPDKGGHLSFGHGIHACIGATLGQLEARVAIEVLLDRLPNLRLADDQEIVPVVSATVRGTQSLRLLWGSAPHGLHR